MEEIMLKNMEIERVRHGFTREGVSKKLNITSKTYLSWIRGVTEIPSGALRELKKLYGVSADYLLEVEERKE